MPKNNVQLITDLALALAANVAGTFNGANVARRLANTGAISVKVGAVTGAPTSFSVVYKLQDSSDGTTFTDILNTPVITLTIANSAGFIPIKPNELRAFYRVVATVAFVGGTSPTVQTEAYLSHFDLEYALGDLGSEALKFGGTLYNGQA